MVTIDMKMLEDGPLPNKELLLREIINKYDEYDEPLEKKLRLEISKPQYRYKQR